MVKTIVLVDSLPMMRYGLSVLIASQADLAVVGDADGVVPALKLVKASAPDLVLVETALRDGDGLELVRVLAAECTRTRTLVFSTHDEEVFAERALRAGASGYVMKRARPADLLAAIREVLDGGVSVSRSVASRILTTLERSQHGLTEREAQTLRLLGEGLTTEQIAQALRISSKTVEAHRAKLRVKLGIATNAKLYHYAFMVAR